MWELCPAMMTERLQELLGGFANDGHSLRLAGGLALQVAGEAEIGAPYDTTLYGEEITSEHLPAGCVLTRALPHDLGLVLQMRERAALQYQQWERLWPNADQYKDDVLTKIEAGGLYIVWGGKDGIDALGMFSYSHKGSSRIWKPEELERPAAYVGNIVRDDDGAPGLGEAMLAVASEWAIRDDKDCIRICVKHTDAPLIAYWQDKGFREVRSFPMNGYPASMLMELPLKRSRVADDKMSKDLAIPKIGHRIQWIAPVNKLSFEGMKTLYDVVANNLTETRWASEIAAWQTLRPECHIFRCRDMTNPWLEAPEGRMVSRLDYETVTSSGDYRSYLRGIGLAESLFYLNPYGERKRRRELNPERFVLSTEPAGFLVDVEPSVSDLASYTVAMAGLADRRGGSSSFLADAMFLEPNEIQIGDSIINIRDQDWDIAYFCLPSEDEVGLQPIESAKVVTGAMQVRIALDDEGRVHAKALTRQATSLRKEVEMKQRKQMLEEGRYIVSPAFFNRIDTSYIGAPVAEVAEDLVAKLQSRDIPLKKFATYIYTFEPYHTHTIPGAISESDDTYVRMVEAFIQRAEVEGRKLDATRMLYARWSRNPIMIRGIDFRRLISPMVIKSPLPDSAKRVANQLAGVISNNEIILSSLQHRTD